MIARVLLSNYSSEDSEADYPLEQNAPGPCLIEKTSCQETLASLPGRVNNSTPRRVLTASPDSDQNCARRRQPKTAKRKPFLLDFHSTPTPVAEAGREDQNIPQRVVPVHSDSSACNLALFDCSAFSCRHGV